MLCALDCFLLDLPQFQVSALSSATNSTFPQLPFDIMLLSEQAEKNK